MMEIDQTIPQYSEPVPDTDAVSLRQSLNEFGLNQQNNNSLHEYELSQSDSLPFLFNLLYDDQSALSKADILEMLSSYEYREKSLPFSYTKTDMNTSIQGLFLAPSLRQKFYQDRLRIGQFSWFRNIPGSREAALAVSISDFIEFLIYRSILTYYRD